MFARNETHADQALNGALVSGHSRLRNDAHAGASPSDKDEFNSRVTINDVNHTEQTVHALVLVKAGAEFFQSSVTRATDIEVVVRLGGVDESDPAMNRQSAILFGSENVTHNIPGQIITIVLVSIGPVAVSSIPIPSLVGL